MLVNLQRICLSGLMVEIVLLYPTIHIDGVQTSVSQSSALVCPSIRQLNIVYYQCATRHLNLLFRCRLELTIDAIIPFNIFCLVLQRARNGFAAANIHDISLLFQYFSVFCEKRKGKNSFTVRIQNCEHLDFTLKF